MTFLPKHNVRRPLDAKSSTLASTYAVLLTFERSIMGNTDESAPFTNTIA